MARVWGGTWGPEQQPGDGRGNAVGANVRTQHGPGGLGASQLLGHQRLLLHHQIGHEQQATQDSPVAVTKLRVEHLDHDRNGLRNSGSRSVRVDTGGDLTGHG